MTKLETRILKSAPVRILTDWTKKIIVPRSEGLSVYEIGRFFIKELWNTKLNMRCAAVTYNFIVAIPPTMLFFFSLIPYLPLKDVQQTILDTLKLVIPNEKIYNNISMMIIDFMNNDRSGILSIGILLTLFFSSNGIMGLIQSFEKTHISVHKKRSDFMTRWTAIKLTVLLMFVGVIAIVALIIQSRELNNLLLKIFGNATAVRVVSLIIVVVGILYAISAIYKYGPSFTTRMKLISTGSVFATIMCIVTTVVFFFLVNNFINYNKVYGSIGTLMAFMLWMWLNTFVILVGFELNVSILLGKLSRDENVHTKKSK